MVEKGMIRVIIKFSYILNFTIKKWEDVKIKKIKNKKY